MPLPSRFPAVVASVCALALSLLTNICHAGFLPLQVRKGPHAAIVDNQQRSVLLRGVNLNGLGDYYQANPEQPTVAPITDRDFADMAALGLNVVRLILSWSALEPQRGVFDPAYLERIKSVVAMAKRHGLYVVLDMHQDAWGKYIASSADTQCGFFEKAIGWDGAPQWATLTDGQSTCRLPGLREASPAVATAFQNFWRNRDGIQNELIATWVWLVTQFAAEPAIAGYDLLNEPNFGVTVGFSQTLLMGNFYWQAIRAIRTAENNVAGGFHHIVFFEPSVEWSAFGITLWPIGLFQLDGNIVFAPHLYSGSITVTGTIASGFANAANVARFYQTPFWSGEWGWFGDPRVTAPQIRAYGQYEDKYRIGGTAWQWHQACGDPHSQAIWGGHDVTGTQYSVVESECPGDTVTGVSPAYATVLSRAYPRYSPGHLDSLSSDPLQGVLTLSGATAATGTLELWVPQTGRVDTPRLSGGANTRIRILPGGYLVQTRVSGNYVIRVDY